MSKFIKIIIITFTLALSALYTTSAFAFANDRVYESGSVWNASFIRTKPGKFDEYMADLENVWLKYIKQQMKDGDILSYKIMAVAGRRKNESDLVLMIEFKNWAVFDRDADYFDKIAKKVQGSVESSRKANVDRESLRTLNGDMNFQELKFVEI